jgi:aminoglycoside phosphotransferase family enzyme
MMIDEEKQLFVYYKSYRANIRAKVNSLRARSAAGGIERTKSLADVSKYLGLMNSYIVSLER